MGDGGKLRQCSSLRGRLVSAVARRLYSQSQEYLDVVVKVEWHAWRCSWAFCLHGVSKCAPAADDMAAKVEQKHREVGSDSGAAASKDGSESFPSAAEGDAADGAGAAYEEDSQYHEDFWKTRSTASMVRGRPTS